jgi:uncharacterized coiled-coil protein SlyX
VSDEFGFGSLAADLSAFRRHRPVQGMPAIADGEGQSRITDLEKRALEQDREIAALAVGLARSETNLTRLSSALESIRAEVSAQKTPLAPIVALTNFDSAIVPQISALFADFGGTRFKLLWRGTRDGFHVCQFHRPCHGHTNTLTLIEDTGGNIFGEFTPLEWDSSVEHKANPSLTSFIFTLKNSHNFPATKFALITEKKDEAFFYRFSGSPNFCDICVRDHCNANTESYTYYFGCRYATSVRVISKRRKSRSSRSSISIRRLFDNFPHSSLNSGRSTSTCQV